MLRIDLERTGVLRDRGLVVASLVSVKTPIVVGERPCTWPPKPSRVPQAKSAKTPAQATRIPSIVRSFFIQRHHHPTPKRFVSTRETSATVDIFTASFVSKNADVAISTTHYVRCTLQTPIDSIPRVGSATLPQARGPRAENSFAMRRVGRDWANAAAHRLLPPSISLAHATPRTRRISRFTGRCTAGDGAFPTGRARRHHGHEPAQCLHGATGGIFPRVFRRPHPDSSRRSSAGSKKRCGPDGDVGYFFQQPLRRGHRIDFAPPPPVHSAPRRTAVHGLESPPADQNRIDRSRARSRRVVSRRKLRLINSTNEYHLWAHPKAGYRFPFGFSWNRFVPEKPLSVTGANPDAQETASVLAGNFMPLPSKAPRRLRRCEVERRRLNCGYAELPAFFRVFSCIS